MALVERVRDALARGRHNGGGTHQFLCLSLGYSGMCPSQVKREAVKCGEHKGSNDFQSRAVRLLTVGNETGLQICRTREDYVGIAHVVFCFQP
jgi:hypothetical protein